jgi:Phage tail tube protein, GTA-gp10
MRCRWPQLGFSPSRRFDMANPWTGEVAIVLDGQRHLAKLTLGALAELEEALETGSLLDLVQRFEERRFSTRDVLALIVAGLRGGGWNGTAADLLRVEIGGGPVGAARAAAELLARAFSLPGET